MSITELKNRLTEKINQIDDIKKLEEIDEMIDWEILPDEHGIYHLTEEQIAAVEESREQIKKGQFLTDEESRRRTDAWLRK